MAGPSRRAVLRLAGLGAVFSLLIFRPWQRLVEQALQFEPVSGLPPFRYLTGGSRQSSVAPVDWMTIGLVPVAEQGTARGFQLTGPDLCRALMGDWGAEGTIPITYFTDAYCPNCRAQERAMEAFLASTSHQIHLTIREFPIFGDASILAAKAALAAERQGAGDAMRRVLQRAAPVRDVDSVMGRAVAVGLDMAQFRADLASIEVEERLALDRAMARRLGLAGTPSLIIGRTVAIGLLDAQRLEVLVTLEASEGPVSCQSS